MGATYPRDRALPPMRWFNNAGPCRPEIHYMLSPTERLPKLERLITQQSYFVIHAPRQVGKTTAMAAFAQQLTASGKYTATLLSVETGAKESDMAIVEAAIVEAWKGTIQAVLPSELQPDWSNLPTANRISTALQSWAESSPRPLVVFIDEIDSLEGNVLIRVLRQFREGASRRPNHFPHALALIGLRDVRDYKVASGGSDRLTTSSPFNIKVASLTMRNFNAAEVATLHRQYTDETGQVFTPEASARAFELTQGQPWLVNALAKEIVEEFELDLAEPILVEHIDRAKEILIKRRDTHIDSLAERLKEDRVRAIIEPMLAGQSLGPVSVDDIEFVQDLGLCVMDPLGGLRIANPIYREVLPRVLAIPPMASLPQLQPSWLTETGTLDTEALLEAFLVFWRQHGQPLLRSVSYHEIAPHLVLMAFLHRVVNGGGVLEREYAIGSDRMDLCLMYGDLTLGIELKVWRQGRPSPLERGLEQLDGYLAGLGLDWGWLVIFDQREGIGPIAERTRMEQAMSPQGRSIVVIYG